MNIDEFIAYQQKRIDELMKLRNQNILLFHIQLFFILLAFIAMILIFVSI